MTIREELLQKINDKTKPQGALGLLETLALRAGIILNTVKPQLKAPHIVVFAADHGIAATGLVNPYPQSVTAGMVRNFLQGGAAINVFCRQHNLQLRIVDVGVNNEWTAAELNHPGFTVSKTAKGSANYLERNALTPSEVKAAIQAGRRMVQDIAATGCNIIGFGEMGIGNSSAAALIMSAMLHLPLSVCTGNGTGALGDAYQVKLRTLKSVAEARDLHQLTDPLDILAAVGGFELAALCGAYLQAAASGMIILVDGFIATASLLIAAQLNGKVIDHCLFSHCSEEKGHAAMLHYFKATPILQLRLRLGEGTGAALAYPLVQSAVLFLNEMASFSSAGLDQAS